MDDPERPTLELPASVRDMAQLRGELQTIRDEIAALVARVTRDDQVVSRVVLGGSAVEVVIRVVRD